MRWVNRLLYNNDKQAIVCLRIGVKITSVQAILEREERSIHFSANNGISIADIQTKVVELVILTPTRRRTMACLSFLLHHIY